MTTRQGGTVVDLITDGRPDAYYVRGHATTDPEALAAVAAHLGLDLEEDGETVELPRLGVGRRLWARWTPATAQDRDAIGPHVSVVFSLQKGPGRGAFQVIEVLDLDQRDREAARQAEQDAHAQELANLVVTWFPEATEIRPHGYPPGEGQVRFRLPGLLGAVCFGWTRRHVVRFVRRQTPNDDSGGDWMLWVETRDLDAWEDLYGERPRPRLASER